MLKNNTHIQFNENVLSAAKRRIAFLLFFNYLLFFATFAILIFDGFIITKNYFPSLYEYGYIILIILVPACAAIKSYLDMPNESYIFASIDHKVQSRGSFSLFNEIYKSNPQNLILEVLLNKNREFFRTLSMSNIFPFRSHYHNYLAAAASFTLLLWIALPQNDKHANLKSTKSMAENITDFSVDTDKESINQILNAKNQNLNSQDIKNQQASEKNIIKNLVNENTNPVNKSSDLISGTKATDQNLNKDNYDSENKNKSDSNKASSSGAGTEEVKSTENIEIKNKTMEGNQKANLNLLESQNQDGVSSRTGNSGIIKNIENGESVNLNNNAGVNQNIQYKDFVSVKYQKIIERYFSDSE